VQRSVCEFGPILFESDDDAFVQWNYDARVLAASGVEALAGYFLHVLEVVAADEAVRVSELPPPPPAGR
jgi:hypothetical protein